MKTYQDLINIGDGDRARMDFVQTIISAHKASPGYRVAADADLYYRHLNPTIMRARKVVYDLLGRAHDDIWCANNKIPCRYYFYLVNQTVQFLLGNGVSFGSPETKDKLGKDFDYNVQKAATEALNGGVSFGFWDADRVRVFSLREFAPLYDEEIGALRAGVRFWQLDRDKPLRCTLYEEDGHTDFIQRNGENMQILAPKKPYILKVGVSKAAGLEIRGGENYEGFPIVPLWNTNRQSEIVGLRETIDAYDLMASALINNLDDANIIYWVIKNAGGMTDIDDQKFIQRLKTLHVVHTEGEEQVDKHTIDVPFEASETALNFLRSQLFDDFMGLDVKNIASGATTATQIEAAYEPLNSRADLFEHEVTAFIEGILALAGVDDTPTYTRSLIVNQQELIQNLVSAGEYLGEDYVTQKILEVLGDVDKAEEVLTARKTADVQRYRGLTNGGLGQAENG